MKILLTLLAMATTLWSGTSYAKPPVTEDDAYTIGMEAYIYAYPMIMMEMTRRSTARMDRQGRPTAPMNHFSHNQTYPDATFHDVVRPNADTLYSSLWFDVGKNPLVLTLPDTAGRYHVIPIMDMWTEVFASLGSRTTGTAGGTFALVGPNWQGTLPKGMRKIVSPTEVGWIIGRIQTNGTADYDHVHQLQAGLSADPLTTSGKPDATGSDTADRAIVSELPPVDQVAAMEPDAYFELFAELMKHNPPHQSDNAILLRMERVGLIPGQSFDLAKADPVVQEAMRRAAADAYQRIVQRQRSLTLTRNGWLASGNALGVYGNDYLQRAFVSRMGLGALPPEDAIYPMAPVDNEGNPLNGASRYILHFAKDQIPPASAFWSLTMYGENQFFVANPINRFAIGDRDKLNFNADGSLDIYIQHNSPGADRQNNWLPAPAGPFTMNLRLYLPKRQAIDGQWMAPPVKNLGSSVDAP